MIKRLKYSFYKKILKEKYNMSNVKLAIVYYSSTGTNYKLAKWAEETAKAEGAEVRLVRAGELAPEAAIASNPAWEAHYNERSEEHTSELQSRFDIVCRLLLEKKKAAWAARCHPTFAGTRGYFHDSYIAELQNRLQTELRDEECTTQVQSD